MDFSHRTPFLDLFRTGEAPQDVRMLAARGAVAPRPHEQLALLMLLTTDEDREVAATAEETLARIPQEVVAPFIARHDVSDEMREFFRARGIEPAAVPAESADEPLIEEADGDPDAPPEDEDRETTAVRLGRMKVAERIKRAMLGTKEERFILIRDVNRMVAAAVLSSPKLADADVEAFAKMANVSEDVLRTIGNSRAWMKSYQVVSSLAMNPKTPVAISLRLVPRLLERDMKMILRDRNLREPLRNACRHVLAESHNRRS